MGTRAYLEGVARTDPQVDSPSAPAASGPALLVFDGKCGFCTRTVEWALGRAREPLRAEPWQRLDLTALGLSPKDVARAAWWIGSDGRRYAGHRAVGRVLRACGGAWSLLGWALMTPPLSWVAAVGYRLVARYRRHLPGVTPACKRDWDGRARFGA